MPTDGEGMEGRDASGALLRKPQSTMHASERRATRAERTLRLQELLDAWRTRAAMCHAKHTLSDDLREKIFLICATELQEVLDA